MAEQVQSLLERMVPPLLDLRDRNIFSADEVRSIVDRRRESEYLLHRRTGARMSDYLRYIEDEIALERLRKLRKERVLTELRNERRRRGEEGASDDDDGDGDDGGRKSAYRTSGPGDSHIVANIHFVYQRTLKRFHYPLELVLNYAEFAKRHRSLNMLGRIYAEGLQRHPRSDGLWIEAASFEYFGNVAVDHEDGSTGEVTSKVVGGSIANARVLLQRGLRINGKTSEEMWVQYFGLELHYVQKLRGRREILELGLRDDGLPREDGGDDGAGASSDELPTNLLPAKIIYSNAIKTMKGDGVSFRLRFVEACRMFPQTHALERIIMDSIARDFGDSADGWVARISHADEGMREGKGSSGTGFLKSPDVDGENSSSNENSGGEGSDDEGGGSETGPAKKKPRVEQSDPALALVDEALESVSTPRMYIECARFLRSRIGVLLDEGAGDSDVAHLLRDSEGVAQAAGRHVRLLEGLYDKSSEAGVSSPSLTVDRSDFLIGTGRPEEAEAVMKDACSAENAPANLWLRWSQISSKMEAAGLKPSLTSCAILRRALNRFQPDDRNAHLSILTSLMRCLIGASPTERLLGELDSLFQRLVLLSRGAEVSASNVRRSRSDGAEDEEGTEEGAVNVAATFVSYLRHCMVHRDGNSFGSAYTTVLYGSGYGGTVEGKTDDETETMRDLFEMCVQFELSRDGSKKDRKEARKRARRVCEGAVGFYAGGGGRGRKAGEVFRRRMEGIRSG